MKLSEPPLTYSVNLHEDGYVTIRLIGGIFNPEPYPDVDELYPDMDTIPEWVKDQVCRLNMMEPDPSYSIAGVGRRLGTNSYWVEYHEGA